jgi:hypothetical protein
MVSGVPYEQDERRQPTGESPGWRDRVGVIVGLMAGAGLFCIWLSFWPPDPGRATRRSALSLRLHDLLIQADLQLVANGEFGRPVRSSTGAR